MSWTFYDVVSTTWRVATNNLAAFLTVALVTSLPQLAVELADGGAWLDLVVTFVSSVVSSVALTTGALQALAGKRRPDVPGLLLWIVQPRAGAAIVLGIVQWLVIGLGFLLLVPGLWVLALWMVAMPALVAERSGIGDALNRSSELTHGRRWRVLGTFLATAIIVATVLATLTYGIGAITDLREDSTGDIILTWLAGAVMDIALAVVAAVLYVALRAEKEGGSVEQIAATFD
jgi:hypothetical protein